VNSWRREKSSPGANLVEVPSPWTTGLVLVCQKCEGVADAPDFVRVVKQLGRATTGRNALRVTVSGCLDVCPTKGIAMAVMMNGATARCVVAESADAVHELAAMWS
jgi:hypothetical protein